MLRELVWIDQSRFRGWGCSECGWVFSPSGPPIGYNLDAMTRNFEAQRNKEFASRLCVEHPRQSKSIPRRSAKSLNEGYQESLFFMGESVFRISNACSRI
jgi:rubredoxin